MRVALIILVLTSLHALAHAARYSEQTFAGAHNSYALRTEENGFATSGNQFYNVTVQLDAGIRLIQGQAHIWWDGSVHLCHASCGLLDGGTLDGFLGLVKAWLDGHTDQVVTFVWVSVGVSVQQWDDAYTRTGLKDMSYDPNIKIQSMDDWPDTADMVSSGKRVVTFLDTGADEPQFPYLLDEFSYVFETPYAYTSPYDYTCDPSRPPTASIPPTKLSFINHFLYSSFFGILFPNVSYAETTNSLGPGVGNLLDHAKNCEGRYGRRPNFLLVDFFDRGNIFKVVDVLNEGAGVPIPSRIVPEPIMATEVPDMDNSITNEQRSEAIKSITSVGWILTMLLSGCVPFLGTWHV